MNSEKTVTDYRENRFDDKGIISNYQPLSLTTYLTTQLQEIICMGPGHLLTWANNRTQHSLADLTRRGEIYDWMQISVHSGTECYLMIQLVLPENHGEALRSHLDHIFSQYSWTNAQGDGRECLVYHVAQSENARQLLEVAESVAVRCAEVMKRLWQSQSPDDIALLGIRGPRLAPPARAVQPKPSMQLLRQPLSQVA